VRVNSILQIKTAKSEPLKITNFRSFRNEAQEKINIKKNKKASTPQEQIEDEEDLKQNDSVFNTDSWKPLEGHEVEKFSYNYSKSNIDNSNPINSAFTNASQEQTQPYQPSGSKELLKNSEISLDTLIKQKKEIISPGKNIKHLSKNAFNEHELEDSQGVLLPENNVIYTFKQSNSSLKKFVEIESPKSNKISSVLYDNKQKEPKLNNSQNTQMIKRNSKFTNVYTLQDFHKKEKTIIKRGYSHDNKLRKEPLLKSKSFLNKNQTLKKRLSRPPSIKKKNQPERKSNFITQTKQTKYKNSFNASNEIHEKIVRTSGRDSEKFRSKQRPNFTFQTKKTKAMKNLKTNTNLKKINPKLQKKIRNNSKSDNLNYPQNSITKNKKVQGISMEGSRAKGESRDKMEKKMERLKHYWYRRKPLDKQLSQTQQVKKGTQSQSNQHTKTVYSNKSSFLKFSKERDSFFSKTNSNQKRGNTESNFTFQKTKNNNFIKSSPEKSVNQIKLKQIASLGEEEQLQQRTPNPFFNTNHEDQKKGEEWPFLTEYDDSKELIKDILPQAKIPIDSFAKNKNKPYINNISGDRIKSYESNPTFRTSLKNKKIVLDSKKYQLFGSFRKMPIELNEENTGLQNLVKSSKAHIDFLKKKL
jgi:hypothetical protein